MASPLKANTKTSNTGDWQIRHNRAVTASGGFPISYTGREAEETPIVHLITSWAEYAIAHKNRHESPIGEDSFLGEYWKQIGQSLRGLLNGALGRLDGGTLDSFILNTMHENGINTEEL